MNEFGNCKIMMCGGWKCRHSFPIENRIAERYCSNECYQDYEDRKANPDKFNYWDGWECVCGCTYKNGRERKIGCKNNKG